MGESPLAVSQSHAARASIARLWSRDFSSGRTRSAERSNGMPRSVAEPTIGGVSDRLVDLRIPSALLSRASEVVETTDRFCVDHLDAEYAELCRRLVGRLARKRPS